MTDEEIKNRILEISKGDYQSLRTVNSKVLKNLIGEDAYNNLLDSISPELQKNHTRMLVLFLRGIKDIPKCKCGSDNKYNSSRGEFSKYCSNKCRFDNMSESVEVRRVTNLEKYGSINVLASDYGKDKIIKTNMEKYGVSHYTKTDEYKESVRGRALSTETIERMKEGIRKKFFNDVILNYTTGTPLFTVEEYSGVKGYIDYNWLCKTCNKEFTSHIDNGSNPICNHCRRHGSKHELLIEDFLTSHGIEFISRGMLLYNEENPKYPKQIDIYIPSMKIGIEICGLYFHSDVEGGNKPDAKSEDKFKHINKLKLCVEMGIRLITIFDDEIYNKLDVVYNRLRSSLGLVKRKVYARKCEVVELDSNFTTKFLDKYHIQGSVGGSYRYGLKYRGRVLAVMTFGKGRYATGLKSKSGVFELVRYCTISNFSIVGGAGKLFNHFIRTESPDVIYSYSDSRWNIGGVYTKIGMTYLRDTPIGYSYTKDFKTRISRVKFQKRNLVNMKSYSENLTEWEIMKLEGYHRIWDCGCKYFEWKSPRFIK